MTIRYVLQQELSWLLGIEAQLTRALPFITESVQSRPLRRVLRQHHCETHRQRDRLREIEDMTDLTIEEKQCAPIQALIIDLYEVIKAQPISSIRDLMLANKLRLIKHYEASRYAKAYQYAQELGGPRWGELLEATRQEEENAEAELTIISVNELSGCLRELYQAI